MKVCVDAGHGGRDPGAVGTRPSRLEEKTVTLAIALLLEEELESRGHWAVMTRRVDRSLGLFPRAAFANRLEAQLFVSIHANAAGTQSAEGIETYHFPASRRGNAVATAVQEGLSAAFPGHRDRGVKEANFTVLRETQMPAVLVETEFITNPRQLVFLSREENQRQIADVIATSIDRRG